MEMKEAVIVAYGRSAIGKAPKGMFMHTRPEDIGTAVLKGTLAKVPQLDPVLIEDVILGCSFPEAEQGFNMARIVAMEAGLPDSVPGQTVNRFCSSGLQSIAMAANAIMAGQAEVMVAGGVEFMSAVPMLGNIIAPNPYLMDNHPDTQTSMGITAENVADQYHVSRAEQDTFSMQSHLKAAKAQAEGKFDNQIIPVEAVKITYTADGMPVKKMVTVTKDEGIRPNISEQALAKLPTVFKKGGTVTPGNASQMSDGAAMVVLMSADKAKELGIKPVAKFVSFAAVGVDPRLMGIGPMFAIPKALKMAGITVDDLSLVELNEAFASQSIACIRELGLNPDTVNVNGGAIALGHPLGCTGSFLTCKLLEEMRLREGSRYGVVSMCIGGGMGAAAVMELL